MANSYCIYIGRKFHLFGALKQTLYLMSKVDCEWGDWMVGECSKSCGVGIRNRSRTKIKEDIFGGQPCVGERNVEEDCNLQVCPGNVYRHWL